MQPDQSSDASAGGQQEGGKGGLKQGLYLQQQQKHGPKQQPLASPAGGALAKAAGVLHAAYRRSSVEDGKGPAAGRAVLAGAAGAAAGAGLVLAGQCSPAAAYQQQPHTQLAQLQPNKWQERVADADTAAAAFEHALHPWQAGRAASAGAAVSTAAGASPGMATGVFGDSGLAPWSAGHHPATTTTSRLPSGKLPALQQQPSPLQQLQHAPAAAAAILTGRGGTAACVPGSAGRSKQQLPQQRQQLLPQQRHQVSRDPYTDPEVQQRTAAWVKLMQDMQQGSDGAQFVYLRYAWLHQLPFNPFDLEVCSHAEAVASGRYFTMSPSGVTAYAADGSRPEFSSLAQWQREWQLHSRLMQMPVFRQHKLWKVFSVWRRAIRDLKSISSTEKLSKGLLLLDPQLQQAVYAGRAACLEVEAVQLSCLVPGQALTLLEYAEAHAAQLDRCQAHLAQVYAAAVATAATASERSLAALQQEMLGVAGAVVGADLARARGSSSDAEPTKPKKGQEVAAAAVTAAAVPVQLLNDSYAMQAARRAQRRRLCDMIRLLDYMLSDAIHSLLLHSLQQMLRCMHGAGQAAQPAAQQEQPTDPSCSLLQTQQQQQKGQHGVVLRLELLLHEQEDQLYLQPHAGEFVEGLVAWLRSVERAVRGVPRLLSSDALQPFSEMTSDSASSCSPDSLAHQMLGADFEHLSKSLEASMQSALAAVQHYMAGYEAFRDMVVTNRAFTAAAVQQAGDAKQLGLTGLRQLLRMYEQQLADVIAIPNTVNVGVVQVCLSRLVDALMPSPQRCVQELRQLLPRLAADAYSTFITRVRGYNERLSRQPGNPEEFVAHAALIAEVEGARPNMDTEYDLVTGFYELLQEFSIQAAAEDLAAAACVDTDYTALRDTAWAAEAAKERHAEEFRYQLEQQAAALAKEVSKLRAEGEQEVLLTESAELAAMIEATGKLLAQVMTQQAAASHLSALSVECGGTPLVLEELEALAEETGLKAMLWAMQQEMRKAATAWMTGPLFGLDVADMQAKVDQFSRQVHKLERGLTPNDLVPKLREEVNRWQEILGPVGHLRNPLLRERHWQAITNLLGHTIDRTEGAATSIQQLLNLQVLDHKEALAAISNEAVQVAALEEMLAAVADKWRNVEFVVKRIKAAKDNFIVGEVDNVMQVLEDSKITISMILSSRYVSGIKSEVDRMDRQLQLFSATLESWLVVQRGWLKLEAVFGAPDIQRQVPGEAAAFAQTSVSGVYAIGDVASFPLLCAGGAAVRQEHVTHARSSAAQAAAAITGGSPAPYDYTPFFYSREFNLSWQFYGQSDGADDVTTFGDLSPAAAAAAAAPGGQAPKFGAYFVKGGAVVGAFVEGPSAEESAALKAVVRARPAAPEAAVLSAEGAAWAVAASSKL